MIALRSVLRARGKSFLATVLATGLALGLAASIVRADAITDENVDAAVAAAKTPADHQALAAYFTAKSEAAKAEVERHRRMSLAFGGKQRTSWEAHCNSLMKASQEQANDYAALAKEQSAIAAALAK
jgi:hypothetical protein